MLSPVLRPADEDERVAPYRHRGGVDGASICECQPSGDQIRYRALLTEFLRHLREELFTAERKLLAQLVLGRQCTAGRLGGCP